MQEDADQFCRVCGLADFEHQTLMYFVINWLLNYNWKTSRLKNCSQWYFACFKTDVNNKDGQSQLIQLFMKGWYSFPHIMSISSTGVLDFETYFKTRLCVWSTCWMLCQHFKCQIIKIRNFFLGNTNFLSNISNLHCSKLLKPIVQRLVSTSWVSILMRVHWFGL